MFNLSKDDDVRHYVKIYGKKVEKVSTGGWEEVWWADPHAIQGWSAGKQLIASKRRGGTGAEHRGVHCARCGATPLPADSAAWPIQALPALTT